MSGDPNPNQELPKSDQPARINSLGGQNKIEAGQPVSPENPPETPQQKLIDSEKENLNKIEQEFAIFGSCVDKLKRMDRVIHKAKRGEEPSQEITEEKSPEALKAKILDAQKKITEILEQPTEDLNQAPKIVLKQLLEIDLNSPETAQKMDDLLALSAGSIEEAYQRYDNYLAQENILRKIEPQYEQAVVEKYGYNGVFWEVAREILAKIKTLKDQSLGLGRIINRDEINRLHDTVSKIQAEIYNDGVVVPSTFSDSPLNSKLRELVYVGNLGKVWGDTVNTVFEKIIDRSEELLAEANEDRREGTPLSPETYVQLRKEADKKFSHYRSIGRAGEGYDKLANLTENIPFILKRELVLEKYSSALKSFEEIMGERRLGRYYMPYEYLSTLADKRREKIGSFEEKEINLEHQACQDKQDLLAKFESFDFGEWAVFRENQDIKQRFGEERIKEVGEYLGEKLLERFLTADEEHKKAFYLDDLLYFPSIEIAPMMAVSYFSAISFVTCASNLVSFPEEAKNYLAFQYFDSLTKEQIDELKGQNIPGLEKVIGLIRANPGTFFLRQLRDPVRGFSGNPVYEEIKNETDKIIVYYLRDKNPLMQRWALDTYMSLPFDSPARFDPLITLLSETEDSIVQEKIFNFAHDLFLNRDNLEAIKIIQKEHFIRQSGLDRLFDFFEKLKKDGREIPKEVTDVLLQDLRDSDPLLKDNQQVVKEISPEKYNLFHEAMNILAGAMYNPATQIYKYRSHFEDIHLLRFVARQPERVNEVLRLQELVPQLFTLIEPGGPLSTNAQNVIRTVFENGDSIRKAKEIADCFAKKIPYWRHLYLFTDTRIGEQLATANSAYPISEIAGVSIQGLIDRHKTSKAANPDKTTRLETIINNHDLINRLISGETKTVPFASLNGIYKRVVFRDFLRRTIEISRDEQVKKLAEARNIKGTVSKLSLVEGTYIHGSRIDFTDSIFLSGNLPYEALGDQAKTDSYPFQTDFSRITQTHLTGARTLEEIIQKTATKDTYGSGGPLGREGQVIYVYQRNKNSYEGDVQYGPAEDHALILGGIPSTEISSIILRNPQTTLGQAKKAVLENGFYVPIYGMDGDLVFSHTDYQKAREDFNLNIPVEVWDYSSKTGEQLGSNPGGKFAVPIKDGHREYYVKFTRSENAENLWNEQLTDNIYRHLGMVVPDTKVIKVAGAYGHASEWMALDASTDRSKLKEGFIFDALLANWDIIANAGNVASKGGSLVRMDNGGALLFRARGERKTEFNGIVTELESMKSGYVGLTQEDITSQIMALREKFTDQAIDQLIDEVRLNQKDRDFLKATLKQRRDYIFKYYSEVAETTEQVDVPEKGKIVEAILKGNIIEDTELSKLVPGWSKLVGEEGYQHNGVLLGIHIKDALYSLKYLPEYWSLSDREKNLALVVTLFHDFGKPTGRKEEKVERDFGHEVPSAQAAANFMASSGYSRQDIATVTQIIINDGVVSDIARSKVRDEGKNLTPEQLFEALEKNVSAVRILRAVNRADVVATVGAEGFNSISADYNEFFDKILITFS